MKKLAFLPFLLMSSAAQAYTCLPSCDVTDGKMLAAAGSDLSTLPGPTIVEITVPGSEPGFTFGVFDGDSQRTTGVTVTGSWDFGAEQNLTFTLTNEVGAVLNSWNGSSMTDNAWFDISVANFAAAFDGSDYVYRLIVDLTDNSLKSWNNYKLRFSPPADIAVAGRVNFVGALFSLGEFHIIYPNMPSYPDLLLGAPMDFSGSTYDGEFELHISVGNTDRIEFWDGDFDRGTADPSGNNDPAMESDLDTDDLDTPNIIPAFAIGGQARAEGVAFVDATDTCKPGKLNNGYSSTGCPADDREDAAEQWRRDGAISYELISPSGTVFVNDNPSGNREWERFTVSAEPGCSAFTADYCVASIESGIYTVRVSGADLSNLFEFYFAFNSPLVASGGQGCTPGYWKQWRHFDDWVDYSPSDIFGEVFDVPSDKTLKRALRARGGGVNKLYRHSTAALLNATNPQVNYRYSVNEVLSLVQLAFETGSYEEIAELFVVENERGCPL